MSISMQFCNLAALAVFCQQEMNTSTLERRHTWTPWQPSPRLSAWILGQQLLQRVESLLREPVERIILGDSRQCLWVRANVEKT